MRTTNQRTAKYYLDHQPGPGKIGQVPKLAEGAVNPMWAIEASIEKIAKRGAEALIATEPKKTKKVVESMSITQVVVKEVELDE